MAMFLCHLGGMSQLRSTRLFTNAKIKVHLTPNFFSRLNKSSCFGEYFFEKIFEFGEILNFLCSVEVEF